MLLFDVFTVQSPKKLSALNGQKWGSKCNQHQINIRCLHYLVAYATNFSADKSKSAIMCNQ